MKYHKFTILLISLLLFSCHKEEGKGGRSTILGKIHMTDLSGNNQGQYFAADYRVYIIYGEGNDVYNDDMKTNHDGTFIFRNLREGNYKIYTLTKDVNNPAGMKPVFVSVKVGKKKTADVGTIEVIKI